MKSTGTEMFPVVAPFLFKTAAGIELRGPLAEDRYIIDEETARTAKRFVRSGDTLIILWARDGAIRRVVELDWKPAFAVSL